MLKRPARGAPGGTSGPSFGTRASAHPFSLPHPHLGCRATPPAAAASHERRFHSMSRDDLREELIATDDEFRRLYSEHQDYERRLQRIHDKALLSQDDEIEEKKIKLHKLVLKDRMEQILRVRVEQRVSA
jgi:uncharacterized protein YdcH (DUF465 family)